MKDTKDTPKQARRKDTKDTEKAPEKKLVQSGPKARAAFMVKKRETRDHNFFLAFLGPNR